MTIAGTTMITVLDTNVISEVTSRSPMDANVRDWVISQRLQTLHTTSITIAELLYGVALLPESHRKETLKQTTSAIIDNFRHRTLSFDTAAASHYAAIVATRRASGHPIGMQDAMIAAIARAHGATVATRNIKDFEGTGVTLVNPWEHTG
ncbi:type II toxin-antitoxin system VapC family toxin [Bifidobacterium parmae]|uniref:Ribonuclease VapC n=1 Tax=Bifidobacterium parmae TaxID=361854 RepID=A0A2N5J4X9_9BIFI|nr:type II toxin-antitoxin system VapC family toxin [Bifidobacterium parmae]PLS29276.1 pilus biogenesis protein [Bifidobacterium parmae]